MGTAAVATKAETATNVLILGSIDLSNPGRAREEKIFLCASSLNNFILWRLHIQHTPWAAHRRKH